MLELIHVRQSPLTRVNDLKSQIENKSDRKHCSTMCHLSHSLSYVHNSLCTHFS